MRMRLISAIMNFYWSHSISLQKLSNERSYKFSRILTPAEVISIRILRMRLISAIINFYCSHSIALQKLSNTPFPNCIIITSLIILELFLRHSENITEFSKNKSLKTQILRKKLCFDQIL